MKIKKNKKIVDIGGIIYFMYDNKVSKATVMGIYRCKYNSWYLYGNETDYPNECQRVEIKKAFSTKEELLETL